MSRQRITPITVFCRDAEEALALCVQDKDSRAIITPAGTFPFHAFIAEHGAGVFKTLYAPVALKGTFAPPVGGEVRFTEGTK
jgi:hypothetical protein